MARQAKKASRSCRRKIAARAKKVRTARGPAVVFSVIGCARDRWAGLPQPQPEQR